MNDQRLATKSRNGHLAVTSEETSNEVDVKLDRVNELWNKLERKLLRRQPPRHITVLVQSERTGEYGEHFERQFLGLQRHHGKWRICYAVDYHLYDENCDDDFPVKDLSWKPITECDLETRIAMSASELIGKLKFEIDNTRTFFIPQLDTAISQLEDALDDE